MTIEFDNLYVPRQVPLGVDPSVAEYMKSEFKRISEIMLDKVGMHGQDGAWFDNLTSINSGKVPASAAPTWTAFGPSGVCSAWAFSVNDHIQLNGFHINHDVKRGSKFYPHVHWVTDGTNTASVKWELSYTLAKGHNQEAFPADATVTVEGTPPGTAWQHMISEVTDANAIDMPEVDTIIIMDLKRVTNGGTDNTDTVFGMFVDLHYQMERTGTINKAPDFYKR